MDYLAIVKRLVDLHPEYTHNFFWAWPIDLRIPDEIDYNYNLKFAVLKNASPNSEKPWIYYGSKLFKNPLKKYKAHITFENGEMSYVGDNSGIGGAGPYTAANIWQDCVIDNPVVPKVIYDALCAIYGAETVESAEKIITITEITRKVTVRQFVNREKLI